MYWDSVRIKVLAAVLTLLLITVIIVLALLRPALIYEPPFLITALNLLFLTVLPFVIAYLALRSYSASGIPGILLLGSGLIAFGSGSLVAGFTIYLPGGTNLTPTIHNSGALLGSILITLSAILTSSKIRPAKSEARVKLYPWLAYAGTLAVMAALSFMAIAGLVPTFFVQGIGPTILRQAVLGTAAVLFTVSSIVYLHKYQASRSYYDFWCGMGFILIALGLSAVFLQNGVGSLIGWAGRVAQYLGCVYLFIGREAVVIIAGEKHITVAEEVANLHRATANYEAMVEIASDAIVSVDSGGHVLTWNTAANKIFGYQKSETVGRTFTSIIGQCPLSDYFNAQVIQDGNKSDSPITLSPELSTARRKNGGLFPAEISVAASSDTGSWICTMIIRDITESKKAEESLRESEKLYRSLFDNMLNGFAYCRMLFEQDRPRDFIYLAVNDAFEKQTGLKDVTGKKVSEVIPGIYEADPQLIETYGRVALSGIPETFETYLASLGMWFSITVYSPAKEHFVAVFDVITERKQREKETTEMRILLQASIESQRDMIIMATDRNYRYLYFNNAHKAAMKAAYGRDVEISMNVLDCITSKVDRQNAKANYDRAMAGESHTTLQVYGDLEKVYYESYYNPIINSRDEIIGITVFARDITDRKRLEQEQQRVEKLESVGVLAGGIAHDFNNILTAIVGNISIARMETEQGSEIYKTLEQAEKASQRARDLTKQLLTFSKGGSPVIKLASLTELLRDTAGFALRGSNVKYNFSIPGDLWHAEIDTGQVSQVVQNLVINGQQAMPMGGTIEISAENITLNSTQIKAKGLPLQPGNYIRVAVTDHGNGIASEHLDRVFDPFFTTKQQGSGLGLATSFSIARQHNGHLSVESEVGTGSTFSLYLPASLEAVRTETTEKQEFKPAGQARILVMDDEQGIKEVAGHMLIMIGYRDTGFAADGAETIKLYKEAMQSGKPFSLAILDLTIPGGMGGKEVIQKLLEIDPGVKAIVSSGYHENIAITKYKEYGFSGILIKPYTVDQLGKALRDALG